MEAEGAVSGDMQVPDLGRQGTTEIVGGWLPKEFEPGLVSVIMPTYNRAALLPQALESICRQTYRHVEVLVVDDGSTDSTAQVLAEWTARYSHEPGLSLRTFRQANAGACAARNYALRESRGEYIQFLDSDDLVHPDRFQIVVDAFREASCDYVFTGFEGFCGICGQILETHVPVPPTQVGDTPPLFMLVRGDIWGNGTVITLRRAAASAVGPWSEDLVVHQDTDYLTRLLTHSDSCAVVPRVLVSARRSGVTRLSDSRTERVGYESFLVGASRLCRGLVAKSAPADVRRKVSRSLAGIAVGLSTEDPDLAGRFASLALGLDARPVELRHRADLLACRSGPVGLRWYATARHSAGRLRRTLTGVRPTVETHVCPGPREGDPWPASVTLAGEVASDV